MITCDIPNEIRDSLGEITSIVKPEQGVTSNVVIVESEDKRFILKHSTGRYVPWLRYEHQVLLALGKTPVPTAKVHRFVDLGAGDTGGCWLLVDYITGEMLTTRLVSPELASDDRCRLFRACGAALAAIHATPPPLCITNHADTWLDVLISSAGREQEKRALMFDKDVSETQARREGVLRMERTRPSVESLTLIHGDCSTNNILCVGNDISGIIDWGCAAVGDPRYDIAQVLCVPPDWEATEINDDVLAFFEGYGTPPVSVDVIRYYQELYEMGGQGCLQGVC